LSGTAARAGEICSLTVRDVVLDGDAPYVRVLGKGGVTRGCPLSLELVPVITNYLSSREERTGEPARRKDPLFLNTRLEPLTTAAFDHCVRRWFNRAGVPMPRAQPPTRSATPPRCSSSNAARAPPWSRTCSATVR